MAKVLVCGGREYTDRDKVWRVLSSLQSKLTEEGASLTIIHGACPRGADEFARQWADEHLTDNYHKQYPADWKGPLGKGAGFARNKQMLELEKPDIVIAFGGRNGTDHMVRISKAADYTPMVVEFDRCDEA